MNWIDGLVVQIKPDINDVSRRRLGAIWQLFQQFTPGAMKRSVKKLAPDFCSLRYFHSTGLQTN